MINKMKLSKVKIAVGLFFSASSLVYAQNVSYENRPNTLAGTASNQVNQKNIKEDPGFKEDSKKQEENPEKNKDVKGESINQSLVFGAWMFNGNFAKNNIQGFNQNYKISIGDKIIVKLWGSVEEELRLVVDKQGNIFIPEVGPIKVVGAENSKINDIVYKEIAKVYKSVKSYVTLDNEQPVKVYVTGFTKNPGLYDGLSSDSLLYYIDRAGGIDEQRGSFLNIEIIRGNEARYSVNLYDFLINGKIDPIQFQDGDVIKINAKKSRVLVSGDVRNAFEFEFDGGSTNLKDVVNLAKPESTANKVYITRKNKSDIKKYTYDLSEKINMENIAIENGDEVIINMDKKLNTVSVRIEGEHNSAKNIVLPIGSTIKDLIDQIEKNNRTDIGSLQLFRESIKKRQKESINESIRILETNILSATSSTKNAAELREKEANMLLKLIDSARKVETKGQVILDGETDFAKVILEDGDIINIGAKTSLVSIAGQVLQPTSIVFNDNYSLNDYIENAGGYLANADKDRIIVRKSSGVIRTHENGIFGKSVVVAKGDDIMVLPKVDMKNTQWVKDISELIYQIAVGAAVILKL